MLSIFILLLLTAVFFLISRKNKNRAFLRWTVFFFFNWFILECIIYGYFIYSIKRGENFFLIGNQNFLDQLIRMDLIVNNYHDERNPFTQFRADPELGYSPGADKFMYQHRSTNSQGIRSAREYDLMPGEDRLRLAVFGDSFVYCDGEVTANSWPAILERAFQNLDVLNFGVSGFGLGQSYLRYLRDGLKFKPDVIFFNYVTLTRRDEFFGLGILQGRGLRNADSYRVRFWIEDNVLKSRSMAPFDLFDPSFRENFIYRPLGIEEKKSILSWKIFSLSNAGLLAKKMILEKKFENFAVRPEDPSLEVNLKILENLLGTAAANDTRIIFFGTDFDNLPDPIQSLLKGHSREVVYVQETPMFDALFKMHNVRREELLNKTNHYNVKGNSIYAEAVAGILKSRTWGGGGPRKFRYDDRIKDFVRVP